MHEWLEPDSATSPQPAPSGAFEQRYRIEALIAAGGMGVVYRATQLQLGRPVAVKILERPSRNGDLTLLRRFHLEAAAMARLNHPHIVTVLDYGTTSSGEPYIAMEYVSGGTLAEVIREEGPLPAARALRIAIQVARALRETHRLGIVHRDLKPANIVLQSNDSEGDFAKLLDFGLAKLVQPELASRCGLLADAEGELTGSGVLVGSPRYMSPEHILGHGVDARSDIYALGVVLFQMLAGRPPYVGAAEMDVIFRHVRAPIPAVSEVAPGVCCPPPVAEVLLRCLAKNPDHRYSSMDEVVERLKQALILSTGEPVSDSGFRAPSALGRLRARPALPSRWVRALVAGIFLVLGLAWAGPARQILWPEPIEIRPTPVDSDPDTATISAGRQPALLPPSGPSP